MTAEELKPVIAALDWLEANKKLAAHRLRQIIVDDALPCQRMRRAYAALMLHRRRFPDQAGIIELTDEERVEMRVQETPCTCAPSCSGGSCGCTPCC